MYGIIWSRQSNSSDDSIKSNESVWYIDSIDRINLNPYNNFVQLIQFVSTIRFNWISLFNSAAQFIQLVQVQRTNFINLICSNLFHLIFCLISFTDWKLNWIKAQLKQKNSIKINKLAPSNRVVSITIF